MTSTVNEVMEEKKENEVKKWLCINPTTEDLQVKEAEDKTFVLEFSKSLDNLALSSDKYDFIKINLTPEMYRWSRWLYQVVSIKLKYDGYLLLGGWHKIIVGRRSLLFYLKSFVLKLFCVLSKMLPPPILSRTIGEFVGIDKALLYGFRFTTIMESKRFVDSISLKSTGEKINIYGSIGDTLVMKKTSQPRYTLFENEEIYRLEMYIKELLPDWCLNGRVPFDYSKVKHIKPFQLFDADRGDNVLVLSPHPDDELIGCGGTLLSLVDNGATVHVLQMTEGARCAALNNNPDYNKRNIRIAEAIKVAKHLDFTLHFWKTDQSGRLKNSAVTQKLLFDLMKNLEPQVVFVPSADDNHRDHRTAHQILKSVQSTLNYMVKVVEYPVWGFIKANTAVNVSPKYEKVIGALYIYQTAMKAEDYVYRCKLLSSFYAKTAEIEGGCAEVFRIT